MAPMAGSAQQHKQQEPPPGSDRPDFFWLFQPAFRRWSHLRILFCEQISVRETSRTTVWNGFSGPACVVAGVSYPDGGICPAVSVSHLAAISRQAIGFLHHWHGLRISGLSSTRGFGLDAGHAGGDAGCTAICGPGAGIGVFALYGYERNHRASSWRMGGKAF